LLLALFLLANVIASVFSSNPVESIIYMAITAFLLITWLFFTCLIYEEPKQTYRIIWNGYIVAAVFTVSLGILGYYRLIPYGELFLHEGRASGTFKDANVFGPYLVPVVIYLGAKLTSVPRANIISVSLVFLFLVFGILLSFSRGAWANLAISTLAYIILRFAIKPSPAELLRAATLGGIITVITVAVVVWAISTPMISGLFFERATLFQPYDIESGGRFSALLAAAAKSFENPIGIGPGQSHYFFITEPHNLYLHIFLETGWLGGITFCFFLILTIWKSFRLCLERTEPDDAYLVVFASVIGILVESMIIHSTHWRHFYLLLAMLWGPILAYANQNANVKAERVYLPGNDGG